MGYYTRLIHEESEHPLLVLGHEESGWQACVSPTTGGEISSLQWLGRELLYRANDFSEPPAGAWRGRAPLLWPAVGRNYAPAHLLQVRAGQGDPRDGSYLLRGERRPMPIHGFAHRRRWELLEWGVDTEAWARLRLRPDDQTRSMYPFEFTLEVEHRLYAPAQAGQARPPILSPTDAVPSDSSGPVLRSTYTVRASSDGLFCSFGNHLTLALPGGAAAYAATRLRGSAPHPCLVELHAPGLLGRPSRARPDLATGEATLADPALLDTVVAGFGEQLPAWFEVQHPELPPIRIYQWGQRLVLPPDSPDWLAAAPSTAPAAPGTPGTPGAPGTPATPAAPVAAPADLYPSLFLGLDPQSYYFVLWGNQEQGFFCPEPWYGAPNSLNLRQGAVWLESGETASWTMQVQVMNG